MSVSTNSHRATSPRGPRAWVNRIPLRVAVLAAAAVWTVVVAECIIVGTR